MVFVHVIVKSWGAMERFATDSASHHWCGSSRHTWSMTGSIVVVQIFYIFVKKSTAFTKRTQSVNCFGRVLFWEVHLGILLELISRGVVFMMVKVQIRKTSESFSTLITEQGEVTGSDMAIEGMKCFKSRPT